MRRASWAIAAAPPSSSVEIDDKYKFLKPGGRVVDLGAAPGGWSQVSAQRVKSVEGKRQGHRHRHAWHG
jgi:23S rRNA C2498 (ribose-2'-O)-methylase RlmM